MISFTSGSLGNLSRHLKRKHPTITTAPLERQMPVAENIAEPVQEQVREQPTSMISHNDPPASSVRAVQKTVQPRMDGFTQKPLSQHKKNIIDQQLVTMIAKEYHPLNLVNDPEFKKFIGLLNPSYSLPTRKTLSESILPQHYLQLKQKVKEDVTKAVAVCVTTDGWTSANNESFIAVTAHYIDPETANLRTNLLGCISYTETHTSVNLRDFLTEELRQWELENKITAIVSDNAANILAAIQLGGWRSISCFAHSLNLVVQAGIKSMSGTLSRVKAVVEYFQRSTIGLARLKDIQQQMQIPALKLKNDVSTRWNSTYDMLERLIKTKEAVIATLALVRNDLALPNEDWALIESAMPILKVFHEVTVEISAEKSVSLSKVIVLSKLLIRQISYRLIQAEAVQDTTQPLLKILLDQLRRRFDSVESNVLCAESTILDPRFKGKGFRDDANYQKALAALKMRVGAMRVPNVYVEPIPAAASSTSTSTSTSIWNDFDEEVATLVPENNTAAGIVEVEKYIQEPMISRLEDPLLWWHARKSVYPLLYQYILKRLNIVATSVPCERTFSKAGLTLSQRRRQLKATKVSQLLFIGGNEK